VSAGDGLGEGRQMAHGFAWFGGLWQGLPLRCIGCGSSFSNVSDQTDSDTQY
jgi:hypothetical protein